MNTVKRAEDLSVLCGTFVIHGNYQEGERQIVHMDTGTEIGYCPFCSRRGWHAQSDCATAHFVVCRHCYARGPAKDNASDAIEDWNRRGAHKPLVTPRLPLL